MYAHIAKSGQERKYQELMIGSLYVYVAEIKQIVPSCFLVLALRIFTEQVCTSRNAREVARWNVTRRNN
jgi:hypothetical protein